MAGGSNAPEEPVEEKIWDLPTRLFKWSLVGAVTTAYVLGDTLSFETVQTHFYAGYVVGALIAFRLIWGVVSPGAASLRHLFPRPSAVIGYARRYFEPEPSHWPGHAPIGGLAVLALLSTIGAVVVTGLFSVSDDFFSDGPLAAFVTRETAVWITGLHHRLHDVLVALVVLHLSAVAFYAVWKREDLIGPMISGWKRVRRREK